MREHPEELLAGYVEGTLDTPERAMVEAHLVGCDACTEEVELATGARAALRELPEEPVPAAVTAPILAEARGDQAPEPVRPSEPLRLRAGYWPQWFPKALAAAAGVVAVILVAGTLIPRLNQRATEVAAPGAAMESGKDTAAGAPPPPSTISLETQNVDYDPAELSQLAQQTAANYLDYADRAANGDGSGRAPLECVAQGASLTHGDAAVRAIAATFNGTAAYLGVYIESPTLGAPPNKVIIWVVSRSDCAQTLSYSYARVD